jgi:hypothetical protein
VAGKGNATEEESMSQLSPTERTWAKGLTVFAATIMIVAGVFQALQGLVALANSEFYVVGSEYTFEFDITAWGWIHLLLGIGLMIAGWSIFAGKTWAAVVALTLAMLSALANFFFIPYYPFWSIIMIALACWVIWALTRPGVVRTGT